MIFELKDRLMEIEGGGRWGVKIGNKEFLKTINFMNEIIY